MQSTATSQRQFNLSKTDALSHAAGPVEISFDLLKHVSGAGPKGGWLEPDTAEALVVDGPKGGWGTDPV